MKKWLWCTKSSKFPKYQSLDFPDNPKQINCHVTRKERWKLFVPEIDIKGHQTQSRSHKDSRSSDEKAAKGQICL